MDKKKKPLRSVFIRSIPFIITKVKAFENYNMNYRHCKQFFFYK